MISSAPKGAATASESGHHPAPGPQLHRPSRNAVKWWWLLLGSLLLTAQIDFVQQFRRSLARAGATVSSYHDTSAWSRWSPSVEALSGFLDDAGKVLPPDSVVGFVSQESPSGAEQLRHAWAVFLLPESCVCGEACDDAEFWIAYRTSQNHSGPSPVFESRDGSVIRVAP